MMKKLIMNKLPQNHSKTLDLVDIVDIPVRISARELHKYVVGLVGIFMLFVITYPIAIHRVAEQSKFAQERAIRDSLTAVSNSIDSPAGN
jgi:hypothetical protein